jgi:hypothetical protein
MNFARFKCDRRGVQSLMRKDAFALQIRNEAQCIGIVAAHAQGGDFNKIKMSVALVELPRSVIESDRRRTHLVTAVMTARDFSVRPPHRTPRSDRPRNA